MIFGSVRFRVQDEESAGLSVIPLFPETVCQVKFRWRNLFDFSVRSLDDEGLIFLQIAHPCERVAAGVRDAGRGIQRYQIPIVALIRNVVQV